MQQYLDVCPQLIQSATEHTLEFKSDNRLFLPALIVLAAAVFLIIIPFSFSTQLTLTLFLGVSALILTRNHSPFSTLMLVAITLIFSTRYLWWRYTATIHWDNGLDAFFALILIFAETYAWIILLLGFLQTIWPLYRKAPPLPQDIRNWPTIDLLIPTYNEPEEIVRNTAMAAKSINWPNSKLNVIILDDGNRNGIRQIALELGVGYIAREDNRFAKAGNLNHALTFLDSELIAIFDCDHIPADSFLQKTAGFFLTDPKLSLVQTPHHFYSADPFEKNLSIYQKHPNEGKLFYGLIQPGNDLWNAAFFCGSCALLRRAAIDDIGGFATDTVTEDAHTSLKMHGRGWNSVYLDTPLAAGLATGTLPDHVGQRIRWARGMIQIFRMDNPILKKGLTIPQKLAYSAAMLHFLSGLPRIIFLLAPLAFLFFHAYIIYADPLIILLFLAPHLLLSALTHAHLQGKYRGSFWNEIYETVVAWYIFKPTLFALINPKKGKFNVTPKETVTEEEVFDWAISKPYLIITALNVIGLAVAVWRAATGSEEDHLTLFVVTLWTLFNLIILGASIAVAVEKTEFRHAPRINSFQPKKVVIQTESEIVYQGFIEDFSNSGLAVCIQGLHPIVPGDILNVFINNNSYIFSVPAFVVQARSSRLGLRLEAASMDQQTQFVQALFAKQENWAPDTNHLPSKRIWGNFKEVLCFSLLGYKKLLAFSPLFIRYPAEKTILLFDWLTSFRPRMPARR
ncbi:UDP-forming cellulose synthase catalytic subunit [Thiomicrorhabdus sp.]|uniref:UDP-forming cellulose synthase catalytic subunit n=1 Tax=Thiomicrorhabdus sp. TaxID=2039724 RepID=UPI0029C9783C|nr:UDP-forming cellulose synthase catalytic subunit [Thiomicrorhabdus sp.]